MNKTAVLELIGNCEDSLVEFKCDEVSNHDLARTLVAFLNLEGGTVLLGVEDDGTVAGVARERLEEWVSELCRAKIEPPIGPLLSWVREVEPGRDVLVVRVTQGPGKPYGRVRHGRRTYYIRVGGTNREASRDEVERMFQASGRIHYGLKPALGATFDTFDSRLRDYFERVLGGSAPAGDDQGGWEALLRNLDLMTETGGQVVGTVDGMLLFGSRPNRHVPQAGIRALCYPGAEPDYATRADEDLRGLLVFLADADGGVMGRGLVDKAWDFVRRNTMPTARLDGMRRVDGWEYPEQVVREALANALVHRDYSVAGTDVTLTIFADRLEVQSPGRLPNTVTVEGMKCGIRYARNQTLVNVMCDYGYVEARGMGVRNKMIRGMRAHSGTEPDLIEEEHRFTVRLWKERMAL